MAVGTPSRLSALIVSFVVIIIIIIIITTIIVNNNTYIHTYIYIYISLTRGFPILFDCAAASVSAVAFLLCTLFRTLQERIGQRPEQAEDEEQGGEGPEKDDLVEPDNLVPQDAQPIEALQALVGGKAQVF